MKKPIFATHEPTTPAQMTRIAIAAMLATFLLGTVAFAQDPGGPGGPGGGFRGGPGGPGGFRGGMRGPRPVTLADVPVTAMDAVLKLTDDQKTKITKIQDNLRTKQRSLRPQRGGPPPSQASWTAMQTKMQGLNKQAISDINAVLTSSQKDAVPGLIKEVETLRATGIPAELIGDLKLTDDQLKQLTDLAKSSQKEMAQKMADARASGDFSTLREDMTTLRDDTNSKAMDILTSTQQDLVTQYKQDHPQRGRGGFGGGGGFGGPPPGGGPPPDGNGPPPPGGDMAPPPADAPPPPVE